MKGIDPGQAAAIDTALQVLRDLTAAFTKVLDSVDAMAGPAGGDPAWPITHGLEHATAWHTRHPNVKTA